MFEGGFLLCAGLAALVVADARLVQPGRFARLLAARPLHFLGTISYGIYLWHWPVIVYVSAQTNRSLRVAARPAAGGDHAGPLDRQLLPGGATHPHGPPARLGALVGRSGGRHRHGRHRGGGHLPGRGRPVHRRRHLASHAQGPASPCPVPAGTRARCRSSLAVAPTAADPLRVMVLGDSVMHDASYGITAALGATGEATVATRTIDGFGLTTATNWPTSIPRLITGDAGPDHRGLLELGHVRADQAQRTPPTEAQYTAAPAPRRGDHADAGQRGRRRDLHPVPPVGEDPRGRRSQLRRSTTRSAGPASSPGTDIAKKMTHVLSGPGHVLPDRQFAHARRQPLLGLATPRERSRTRPRTSGSVSASSTTSISAPRAVPATPTPCWPT